MDNCQREQAIESSATMNELECSSSTPSSLSDSTPTNSIKPKEKHLLARKSEKSLCQIIRPEKIGKPKKMLTLF